MIDENLVVPFETIVFGAPVKVERVDLNARGRSSPSAVAGGTGR
jgi:hypothetical protein